MTATDETVTPYGFEVVDAPDDAPTEPYEYSCEVCGTELFYAGKGRKPRYCEEHKGGKERKPGSQRAPRSKLTKLNAELTTMFTGIGTMIYPFEQFDGAIIVNGSPRLADGLVALAEQNPRVRKALEDMLKANAYAAVMLAVMPVALPILAHHGILPMDEYKLATALGHPAAQ